MDDARQFTDADLANVFTTAARASNREWRSKQRDEAGIPDFELPPGQAMFDRSPIVNYARQILPQNVGALGNTAAGQWVANQVQRLTDSQPQMKANVQRAQAFASRIPLGGYSPDEMQSYQAARSQDENLRRNTVEVGKVPIADNSKEVRTKGDIGATAAQAAGVVAGDMASDGLRNIWWFINAPQAAANLLTDDAIQREGYKIMGRNEPIIKNRATRMAATLPAVLATSFGIGNITREEGYKAVLPSDEDPKQSQNGLAEVGARYFLGRTGGLLPYNEFVKERPDVSREEYENYKNYLFANKSPVKATLDGIHGPEVNFMGKSVPLVTGMVPIAAAVYGARRGMKRAGRKLTEAAKGKKGLAQQMQEMGETYAEMKRTRKGYETRKKAFDAGETTDDPVEVVSQSMLNQAAGQYNDIQRKVERITLENAVGGGAAGALTGGVGAMAIESILRSLKPQYTAEDSE